MALFSKGKQPQQSMSLEEKCAVLGLLWLNYREEAEQDEVWSQFFSYADLGLPMSYMLAEELAIGPSDVAVTIIDETWDSFCELLSLDARGYYDSLAAMFDLSPQPALQSGDAASVGHDSASNDHGLEGFMGRRDPEPEFERTTEHGLEGFRGRRVPDRERTIEHVMAEFTGGGQHGNGPAATCRNEPNITVTKNAWREIGTQCRTSGLERAQVRLHILPCQCGGRNWGLSFDDGVGEGDVFVSNGSETIVLDPVSAKNARQTYLDTDGRGGGFLFSMSNSKFCECGDDWRPTMAVAAMAVAFGVVSRHVAIANGWFQDNSGYADTSADYGGDYSDSGGGDYDVGFDFGGF